MAQKLNTVPKYYSNSQHCTETCPQTLRHQTLGRATNICITNHKPTGCYSLATMPKAIGPEGSGNKLGLDIILYPDHTKPSDPPSPQDSAHSGDKTFEAI